MKLTESLIKSLGEIKEKGAASCWLWQVNNFCQKIAFC